MREEEGEEEEEEGKQEIKKHYSTSAALERKLLGRANHRAPVEK